MRIFPTSYKIQKSYFRSLLVYFRSHWHRSFQAIMFTLQLPVPCYPLVDTSGRFRALPVALEHFRRTRACLFLDLIVHGRHEFLAIKIRLVKSAAHQSRTIIIDRSDIKNSFTLFEYSCHTTCLRFIFTFLKRN